MFDFVIELGDSHNGDAERARRLVREAARAGAKGVLLDASRLEDELLAEDVRRTCKTPFWHGDVQVSL